VLTVALVLSAATDATAARKAKLCKRLCESDAAACVSAQCADLRGRPRRRCKRQCRSTLVGSCRQQESPTQCRPGGGPTGPGSAGGQITYEATTRGGDPVLFRVAATPGAVPENVSARLDAIARFPGTHRGPFSVSPDGAWYAFQSERFDELAAGDARLTIAPADLSSAETIRVNGEPLRMEGAQPVAGGDAVVYVDGGGPHERDLWIVRRADSGWAAPQLLTGASPYPWNYWPVLTRDGGGVLFDTSDDPTSPFPSTRICRVGLDGSGFAVVVTKDDGPPGTSSPAVHSPAQAPDGSVVFEAEWEAGEQIWRLPASGGPPVRVTPEGVSDDNSPVVLPDGRIASLLVEQTHELKLMNADGSEAIILVPGPTDVSDIGFYAAPSPTSPTLFEAANPWDSDVTGLPKSPQSDTIVQALDAAGGWGTGAMRIDFGLQVLTAEASTPFRPFTPTDEFYDPDCDQVPFPVPSGGVLEEEDGYRCTQDGDCHLLVVHPPSKKLYEMWRADDVDGAFRGGCAAVWDLTRSYPENLRGEGCTSADAGGFPIAAMVFTADEVSRGEIRHALRFILPNSRIRERVYVHPGTHSTPATSGGPDLPPYGVRLRLRADFPLETLPSEGARVVARALQRYGMFLADGGLITLTAASDRFTTAKWADVGIDADALTAIQVTDMEVVAMGEPITWSGDCVRNTF
jgi:serine/threonine-protein kinase